MYTLTAYYSLKLPKKYKDYIERIASSMFLKNVSLEYDGIFG